MKVLNKISNIIIDILIVIVFICLIFAVYNYVQLKVLGKQYTNYFGYTYFEILTGSMENEINIDDYVFVKITKDIKEDDIISFRSGNDVITHRVIEINEDNIITKGDANNAADPEISKNDVIGKVVFIGHKYGKYLGIVTEPIVFISFFATVILFNIAFSLPDKERSMDDEEKKKI